MPEPGNTPNRPAPPPSQLEREESQLWRWALGLFVLMALGVRLMVRFSVGMADHAGELPIVLRRAAQLAHLALYAMLLLLLLTFAFLRLLLASRFGRALAGIRSNEQRMRALGFNTYAYKLAAFTIAGAIAGVAGYFAAVQFGFVNPEMLSWHQSANVLLMVILGGLGNLFGAIVGAFAFVLLQDLFSSLTKHWLLFMGGFVILAVMLLPGGLTRADEAWQAWLARMRRG